MPAGPCEFRPGVPFIPFPPTAPVSPLEPLTPLSPGSPFEPLTCPASPTGPLFFFVPERKNNKLKTACGITDGTNHIIIQIDIWQSQNLLSLQITEYDDYDDDGGSAYIKKNINNSVRPNKGIIIVRFLL